MNRIIRVRRFSNLSELRKLGFKERARLIQEEVEKYPLSYGTPMYQSLGAWVKCREKLFDLMRQPDKYAAEIKETTETVRNQEITLLLSLQQRTSEEKELSELESMQRQWNKAEEEYHHNRVYRDYGMSPEEFNDMMKKEARKDAYLLSGIYFAAVGGIVWVGCSLVDYIKSK